MFCCGKHLKVEAEICADPIWCHSCSSNLDIDALPIFKKLYQDFNVWNLQFDEILPFNSNMVITVSDEYLQEYNKKGNELTKRLQKELGSTFKIDYFSVI